MLFCALCCCSLFISSIQLSTTLNLVAYHLKACGLPPKNCSFAVIDLECSHLLNCPILCPRMHPLLDHCMLSINLMFILNSFNQITLVFMVDFHFLYFISNQILYTLFSWQVHYLQLERPFCPFFNIFSNFRF
jgi:hypothetical protein